MESEKNINAKARQDAILDYLDKNEHVEVSYLCEILGVSDMTIRRDLEKLEEERKLIRVYGGARSIQKAMSELPLNKRLDENFTRKTTIGKYCAGLIQDGDVIALDGSSTALAMARYIEAKALVVTNNISVAQELSDNENVDVVLLGGNVRKSSCSTVGLYAVNMMKNFNIDKLFLSSKAVDFTYGISDATQAEGEIKRAMIESSKKIILMVDSTKLGKSAFYKVYSVERTDTIVTDYCGEYSESQREFMEKCRLNNVDIRLIGKKEEN